MSRDTGDDHDKQPDRPSQAEREDADLERDDPQRTLGNSLLAAMTRPLYGSVSGPGQATDAGMVGRPDDDEVIEVPAGAAPPPPVVGDLIFGHPDWVPPARPRLSLEELGAWLPPPLPDPWRFADARPAVRETGAPGPAAPLVRLHADAWLRAAVVRLETHPDGAPFAALAGEGARRLLGPDIDRSTVLCTRVAAASLGLAALGHAGRGDRLMLDVLAGRGHLDVRERLATREGAGVPVAAALAARTLSTALPGATSVVPQARHTARGEALTLWAQVLGTRPARARLGPPPTASAALAPALRDDLEQRAVGLYRELFRLRARMAGAAEVLAWSALPHLGTGPRPGLMHLLQLVDARTDELLGALREVGQGLHDPRTWPAARIDEALRHVAAAVDELAEGMLASLARWTAALVEPEPWHARPTPTPGPWRDALAVLQQGAPRRDALPEPLRGWPWLVAAVGTRSVRQSDQPLTAHRSLLATLAAAGDPGALSAAMAVSVA